MLRVGRLPSLAGGKSAPSYRLNPKNLSPRARATGHVGFSFLSSHFFLIGGEYERTKGNQSTTRRAPEAGQERLGPFRRNPRVRSQRTRFHSARMARHVLPLLGGLHPG